MLNHNIRIDALVNHYFLFHSKWRSVHQHKPNFDFIGQNNIKLCSNVKSGSHIKVFTLGGKKNKQKLENLAAWDENSSNMERHPLDACMLQSNDYYY
jgi:hypothetical protein